MKHALATALLLFLSAAARAEQVPIGGTIDDFRLPGTDGKFHSIATDGGKKATVLVFWSNRSPNCNAQEKDVLALARDFAPKDIRFILVNSCNFIDVPDETFDKMQQRASAASYPFPYVSDNTQQLARTLNIRRTPTALVVSPDRRLLYRGAITLGKKTPNEPLRAALANIAEDKPVEVAETNPAGTGLSWSPLLSIIPSNHPLRPGDIVRPFWALGADNRMHSVKAPLNNPTVVVFTSLGCDEGKAYMNRLVDMSRQFVGSNQVDFYLVFSNDDAAEPGDAFDKLSAYAAAHPSPLRLLRDENQRIARQFGVQAMPHAFLLNRIGAVLYEGSIDDDRDPAKVKKMYLLHAVRSQFDASAMEAASTPVTGCDVKWKTTTAGR